MWFFGKKKKEEKKREKQVSKEVKTLEKEEEKKTQKEVKKVAKSEEKQDTKKKNANTETKVEKSKLAQKKTAPKKETPKKEEVKEKPKEKATKKSIYRVVYDKSARVWAIKKDGAKRTIANYVTKEEALARVKELSSSKEVGFIVHKKDGKFQKK